ncbi:MAG: alpha/beta fold hydrolase [Acidobacteria bacterium]|nr:alpha/beta fold hydrolase [Acidobacteriota bacterium]
MSRPAIPTEPFVPRFGLAGAHRQTLASALLPREDRLPQPEERRFRVAEDAQVLAHCHWQPEPQRALTVVLVHGLEGSSRSQYILGTANKCWAAGWNVVRMNMRNCGGTEHLAPSLYHSGMSGDAGAVALALIREDHLPRVALAGFSMGGNLVLKLAGEWGREAPPEVRAFAAVCPAADLAATADAIHLPQNRLYEWNFLRGLTQRLRRKARLFPDRFETGSLGKLRSMRDFDDRVTARYCGFAGANDYYARSSAARVVDRIALPTLVIHSGDDPFVHLLAETRVRLRANPSITYVETERGGHCAFLAPPNGYDGRWAERQIVEFLKSVA